MKRSIYFLTMGFALLFVAFSCKKEEGADADQFVIAQDQLSFTLDQYRQVIEIPVQSNIPESEWEFASSASWISLSPSVSETRGLMVAVAENGEKEGKRRAQVTVGARGRQYRISVDQIGKGPYLEVNDVTIDAEGGTLSVKVISNIPGYKLGDPVISPEDNAEEGKDWFVSTGKVVKVNAETRYEYRAQNSLFPYTRKATMSITSQVDASILAGLDATQKAQYEARAKEVKVMQSPVSIKGVPTLKGEKVKIVDVTGSEIHAGMEFYTLIDGDYTTTYHSRWGKGYEDPTTTFPVTFEFELESPTSVEYMYIMSSKAWDPEHNIVVGESSNGDIGEFSVWYKTPDDKEYKLIGEGDFQERAGYNQYIFPEAVSNAISIMLKVESGSGDNGVSGGFVTAAEVEFWKSNADEINGKMEDIFTDLSCSELKEGVTKADIIALGAESPVIAVAAATPLMENTYGEKDKEFRIRTYDAFSDNTVMFKELYTQMYTAMDNPTGVHVNSGEVMTVCLDKAPEHQKIRLAIYGDNGDEPNYGGGGLGEAANQIVGLRPGVNSFTTTASGMLYVLNTSEDLSQYNEPVKVHILPSAGDVQGFFDLATMKTNEKLQELLDACTYKYFVIRGQYFMFNFHTQSMKRFKKDGKLEDLVSGIKAWDKIICWQHELMGLKKLAPMSNPQKDELVVTWCHPRFNNHMMAISSEGEGYMDASTRRVRFVTSSLGNIITLDRLLSAEDNSWGPAHEAGHDNQQAINWRSTTESSNNLFSNYVIYKWGKYGSRGATITDLANSYANPDQPWALYGRSGVATYQNEDPEIHMRMNWQLWNYFHRCGYDEEFFPTLFNNLREDPLHNEFWAGDFMKLGDEDLGYSQLQYYKMVCKAAQMDFTEFFKVWGFFEPINQAYDQYGTAMYIVTEEMITDAKNWVDAQGWPAAPPIQYIEDRTVKSGTTYSDMGYIDTYKNKVKITKTPSIAVLYGNSYSVSNGEQAVAVELRQGTTANGELLYFSNRKDFVLPDGVSASGNTFWAVQYDGKRIKMQ